MHHLLEVLARESMLVNKLRQYFETTHRILENKDRKYFTLKADKLKQQKITFSQNVSVSLNVFLASQYAGFISCRTVKETHTVTEELILPVAIDIFSIMVNENIEKKKKNSGVYLCPTARSVIK